MSSALLAKSMTKVWSLPGVTLFSRESDCAAVTPESLLSACLELVGYDHDPVLVGGERITDIPDP